MGVQMLHNKCISAVSLPSAAAELDSYLCSKMERGFRKYKYSRYVLLAVDKCVYYWISFHNTYWSIYTDGLSPEYQLLESVAPLTGLCSELDTV
jgi:hypothetical protein